MCGIAGIIDIEQNCYLKEWVKVVTESMTHRGPDGNGFFESESLAMGMRRLAVIDLEHGWQPQFSANNRIIAFQNGEIYNHRQLRLELQESGYHFNTQSDTEVLAHGYHCWGIEKLLTKLDGMYAIAICDLNTRYLHLARDRFGEKPLFYAAQQNKFAFASSATGIAALDWVDTNIDEYGLDQYLATHFVAGSQTIYSGIERVLPGHRMQISLDDANFEIATYYRLPSGQERDLRPKDLKNIIDQAVQSRMVADVPLGVFLSGGLDSAIVAAVAAKYAPKIATFSMGFQRAEFDESAHAAVVAKHIDSQHHHFTFDESCFMDLLPQVASALDEPVGDQALLPVFWLSREARKSVTVVLTGEGADEAFAGYGYYRGASPGNRNWLQRLYRQAWQSSPSRMSRYVHNPTPQTPSGFPLVADPGDRERLTGKFLGEPSKWEIQLMETLDAYSDPLQRATATDLLTWLPDDLLVKLDRMAMANSLEGRAPYLDPRVVDAGFRLASDMRMTRKAHSSKIALREIAKTWLPQSILKRNKQGFCLPMKSWIQQWYQEQGGPMNYLRQKSVPGINSDAEIKLVNEDLARGVKRDRLMFSLILLHEWYDSASKAKQALRVKMTQAGHLIS